MAAALGMLFCLYIRICEGLPHIILVTLDSVGKGDLFTGEDKMGYSTPGFSKLASVGAVLRNYYVQPETSPSKASILTGKYPFKLGMQEQLVTGSTAHIPLNVPTLPELLRAAGNFETHLVGGWGLGYARVDYTPTLRGFDSFYGFLGPEIDYVNKTKGKGFDFWDEKGVAQAPGKRPYSSPAHSAKGNYSTRQYRARVNEILTDYVKRKSTAKAQSDAPLFMMISHQAARQPLEGHPDQSSKCKKSSKARKRYCAMMIELDDAMADLHQTLIRLNLWVNSLVIVTSLSGSMVPLLGFDSNGEPYLPGSVGSNYPLRGSRSTLFEGGIRGIALITGGKLQPAAQGRFYDGLAHVADVPVFILSAIFEETAGSVQTKRDIALAIESMDGLPFTGLMDLPSVRRIQRLQAPRTEIPVNIVASGTDYSAIRFGRWKLIIGFPQEYRTGDGWWPSNAEGPPQMPKPERHRLLFVYKLYDLFTDPQERQNMVNLTDIVREGRSRIKNYIKAGDYQEPQFNAFNPWALPVFHGGAWAPFLDLQSEAKIVLAVS